MKVLANRVTDLTAEKGNATYGDLITMCLKQPVHGGLDVATLRKRLRILDVVEKANADNDADAARNSEYRFEDEDARVLQECVKTMRWPALQREFVNFADAVLAMPEAAEG